jgi:hypothetical protein
MQDYLPDGIENNKTFQMVYEKVHFNPKYKSYVHGKINTVIANKGGINVFNPTGDEAAKQLVINEFLID